MSPKEDEENVLTNQPQRRLDHSGKINLSLGRIEPPAFRLTVERANHLRHSDLFNNLPSLHLNPYLNIRHQRNEMVKEKEEPEKGEKKLENFFYK